MKKQLVAFLMLIGSGLASWTFAAWLSNSTPEAFLDRIVQTSNSNFRSQKTQLDDVSAKSSWNPGSKYKITGTLGNIAQQIEPYLQWLTFIGLSSAVILLMRNGFKLVTGSSGLVDGGDMKTVKGNIQSILTGIIILTWFVAIIRIIVWLINFFFSK